MYAGMHEGTDKGKGKSSQALKKSDGLRKASCAGNERAGIFFIGEIAFSYAGSQGGT
jgi:hypothetical protein